MTTLPTIHLETAEALKAAVRFIDAHPELKQYAS
jgi:hypothetical protein